MILKRRNVEVEEYDTEKIRHLKSQGFKVIETTAEEKERDAEAVNYKEFTVKELRTIAKDKGLVLSKTLKKDEIIEVLEGLEDEGELETETIE